MKSLNPAMSPPAPRSNSGSQDMVHGFSVPHHMAKPMGDGVIVRVPRTPEKLGGVIIPQQVRDIFQHNVVVGRIISLGPVAFWVMDPEGGVSTKQDVEVGDWAIIRPFSGTFIQPDGKVGDVGGFRYLSGHRDVLAIVKAADMPRGAMDALERSEDL